MKQEGSARLIRLESGSTKSADHRQHRRTLAHRNRKRGSSTLSSLTPPVRLDDSTFTVMGARDVVLRTKKPVPDDLDIRSFQIVEVRRTHRGVNGALGERRYALHLQVAVEYPEPADAEAIETPEQILGIDDGVKKHIAFSNVEFIHHDESAAIAKERQGRMKASRKKKGSRRQRNTLIQVRRSARKRVANRRRLLCQAVQSQYRKGAPDGDSRGGQERQESEQIGAWHKTSARHGSKCEVGAEQSSAGCCAVRAHEGRDVRDKEARNQDICRMAAGIVTDLRGLRIQAS